MRSLVFHRLVPRDLRIALDYYETEGGKKLGDRFFEDVEKTVESIWRNPEHHHFCTKSLRRASLQHFPFHLLFEADDSGIWVAVLRHDKQHPRFGLRRQR